MCTRITKTIILKSPDSNKVREVIVTPVVLPNSEKKMLPSFNQMEYTFTDRLNRKRRLEHLSLEEKILRKKLKNREAAQTSRDRKKARLEQLEETVKRIQEENDVLHEEIRSLKNDKESLTKENSELREELWSQRVGSANLGPAAGNSTPNNVSIFPPSPCSVFSEDWDWLDSVKNTPDLEQLEELANSLFAQAVECKEFEEKLSSSLGTEAESMESNRYKKEETVLSLDIGIEGNKTAVTHPIQCDSEQTKPAVIYPVPCDSDDMVFTAVVRKNSDLIYIEDAVEEVTCLSDDDCVVKEEIILSDIVDPIKMYSESYEEVSDNGYESVDSPLSEPDNLSYLFPQLW